MIELETIKQIRNLATKFRIGVEKCDRRSLPITFKEFPRGACGDAALLLGKYLKNEGFGSFQYVCGIRRLRHTNQEHAWLRQEALIIDITADQFAEIDEPVIITTNHTWYSAFNIRNEHEADYELYDHRTRSMFADAYCRIVANTNVD
jgi:hypothetical protein